MLLWTMCISLEILVITYLFPTLKYDILITRPAKKDGADFYSLKYEFNLLLE